jgi:hypothetical protein
MKGVRVRVFLAAVIAAALAPAALAYIHSYSGYLTGTDDVDTFSFTADAAMVEFEFSTFDEAVVEVDVTRDGRYLAIFGVDGFAEKAGLVDIREDEKDTGNVKVEDEGGKALVRIVGGGEYYVAVRSVRGSAQWSFTWRPDDE